MVQRGGGSMGVARSWILVAATGGELPYPPRANWASDPAIVSNDEEARTL